MAGQVQAIALELDYSPGWVSHQYRNRWGEWPPGEPGREVTPLPPTDEARDEVEASIKAYRRERRAKREAKG